jgi:C4-dicarboxylate transporter DctQ subunit
VRAVFGALLLCALGLLAIRPAAGLLVALALVIAAVVIGRRRGDLAAGFAAIDDLLFGGERLIVAGSLLVMGSTVFVDVVWRTSHSLDRDGIIGFGVAGLLLCLAGGATARWPGATAAKRVLAGLAGFAVLATAVVLIHFAPNGFGWSQRVSLVLLLWVGLLGGSMASKESRHIAVDAVRRVVPPRYKRAFEIAGGLVTVALCAFLAVLGAIYAHANWVDWIDSELQAARFESVAIPYWAATLPIPIGFGLMAARFVSVVLHGVREVDLIASLGGAKDAEPPPEEPR